MLRAMPNLVPSRILKQRLKLATFLLLGLLVAIYRPILHRVVDLTAKHFASKAGFRLEWELRGGLLSDIEITRMRLTGPEGSVLRKVEWSSATAGYSLWQLTRKRPAEFLHHLDVRDAQIELDLRTKPHVKPDKPKARPAGYWIGHIELHSMSARVLTDHGELAARGLTLVLNERKAGGLEIEEFMMPSRRLRLANVRGQTHIKSRAVTLTDVHIAPEVMAPSLELDLARLEEGAIPFHLDVRSGEAAVQAAGSFTQIWDRLEVDISLKLNHLAHSDVRRWTPLPDGMVWRIDDADVRLRGPLGSPEKLTGTVSLAASSLQIGGLNLDDFRTAARLGQGSLTLDTLSLQSGINSAKVSGTATLPATWRQMGALSARMQWEVKAPRLETLFIDPTRFSGRVDGQGDVSLINGKLSGASATLDGSNLRLFHRPIASVTARVSSDAEVTRLKSVVVRVDDQNRAHINGDIRLDGNQPASLSWDLNAADVPALVRWAALTRISPPDGGRLTAKGTAGFSLTEFVRGNFENAHADAEAQMDGFSWPQRQLENVTFEASLSNQLIQLKKLDVRLGEANSAHFSGNISLRAKQAARISWQIDLRDLAPISKWAGLAGMPPPTSGAFFADGEASGPIAELRNQDYTHAAAVGSARLSRLSWQNGHMDSAIAGFVLGDGRAELKQLDMRFDSQNRVTAKGHAILNQSREFDATVTGSLNQLSALTGWFELAKAPRITNGRAAFSWIGKGNLSTREITGTASVRLNDLKRHGSEDAFSLILEGRHEGRRAEIAKLQLTAGSIRADASASITDVELKIPKLSLFSGGLRLVDGSAQVPLIRAQNATGIRVDPNRPLSVRIHANKLDMTKLLAALGQKPAVSGIVNGDMNLDGSLPNLNGSVSMRVQDLHTAGIALEPASLQLNATLARNRINVTATARQVPLRTITATAVVPFDPERMMAEPRLFLDAPVDATLHLPDSDLSGLRPFFPMLSELQGTVGMNVRASGPLKSIQWQGHAHLDVPSAELKQGPITIRDMRVRASLSGPRITLDDVSATLSGGYIRGTGVVDLVPLSNPALNVHFDAKEALIVRDDTMSLRADGSLACIGTVSKAQVTGNMELVRGRVFKEIEFLPLSLPHHLPPPPPPIMPRAKMFSLPPLLHQWTFDINVVTRDPVRLLGNVLNGGAVANLHVGGSGAAPDLEGNISLEGARVRLPFSRLAISRGDIIFSKEAPLDPRLDLQGESVINNYVVTVRAYGSALAPKLNLSSSPPLKENEIASLLATGSAAGNQGGVEGEAANRAAYLIVTRLYRQLLGKAAPKRFDEEPPRLTFTFSPLSTGTAQRGVSATYDISTHLQAVGTVGDRGFRGLLHYLVRFR